MIAQLPQRSRACPGEPHEALSTYSTSCVLVALSRVSKMPNNGLTLSATDVNSIKQWIVAGAPNN